MGLRQPLRRIIARLMGPGLAGLEARLDAVEHALAELRHTLDRPIEPGSAKRDEELRFWRWLVKTEAGARSIHGPFDRVFGAWQRDRLRELARCLRLAPPEADAPALDAALDAWCPTRSAVEIGAGPYPALAAAGGAWRRAVAVDPLAREYAAEGLLPKACERITYIAARGEDIPLPDGTADLVIIENALDHVEDPAAVLNEARRLLVPGGLLWLLVDLSTYSDAMHPHPFDEARLRHLLGVAGFETVTDRVSDHKSHPKAFGEYRGLLRKPGGGAPEPGAPVEVKVVGAPSGAGARTSAG